MREAENVPEELLHVGGGGTTATLPLRQSSVTCYFFGSLLGFVSPSLFLSFVVIYSRGKVTEGET